MRPWLTRNLIALGLVSLFTDAASEMVIPLLPIFLTTSLGATAAILGVIEGVADGVSSVLKLVSGRIADRVGKNRPLVIAGYTLSSIVKPLLAFAASPLHVLLVRIADRTGKGIRTSPRDALLAGSAPAEFHGRAFGFHRAMDHVGAIVGPLAAFVLLEYFQLPLEKIFLFAAIPGALVIAALLLGVRETPALRKKPPTFELPRGPLLRFLIPVGVFALGNASDAFLLLRANAAGVKLSSLPLLWIGLHFTKAIVSFAAGSISDRLGARKTIAAGWLAYIAIYTAFMFAESTTAIAALFVIYGIFHGLTEGPERALVASLAAASGRGSAFGFYHLTVGLLAIPAGLIFGGLWDTYGSQTAFASGAAFALLALILLATLSKADAK
jgi:MFS family permease